MSKLIVLIGTSLSGKTTWAQQQNAYIVSRDSERESLFGEYRQGNLKEEALITEIIEQKVKTMLQAGDVILDNTHLKQEYLDAIPYTYPNTDIEYKIFPLLEKEELIQRNNKRWKEQKKLIPERVLHKQIKSFQELVIPPNIETKGQKVDPRLFQRYNNQPQQSELPWCVIVDLDGTLSLMNGRSAYSGKDCGTDILNKSVYTVLDLIGLNNYDFKDREEDKIKVFLFSGRNSDNGGKEATEKWLQEQQLPSYELVMRAEGDNSPDTVIKRKMFDKYIRGKYRVHFVLDDRNVVTKMWRDLGLDCFQVYDGNF